MTKEFNLEDYHTGKYDVVTRDGHKVQILKTDVKNKYPVVGIVTIDEDKEAYHIWSNNGSWDEYNETELDLFLVSKTEKIYLVHFICHTNGLKGFERYCVKRYVKKEDADRFVKHCAKDHHYKFLRIEEVEVDEELFN